MTLSSRVDALATRVGAEFKTVRGEFADDAFATVTFGATSTADLAASENHALTVTGNTTLDASGLTEGQAGSILLTLNGAHTVSFAAKWTDPPEIPAVAGTYWLIYQVHPGGVIRSGLGNG